MSMCMIMSYEYEYVYVYGYQYEHEHEYEYEYEYEYLLHGVELWIPFIVVRRKQLFGLMVTLIVPQR